MRSVSKQKKIALVALVAALVALGSWRLAFAAPAPPLRAVVVEYVASSSHPNWEPIPSGAFATGADHGGTSLWVQTREDGYGQNQIARFNSFNMRLLQSAPVLDSQRNVVGWRRVWLFSGSFSSGRFTFQANSLVGVPTVRSTALNVR